MIERTGLHNDIAEVLITEEEIKEKVRELGKLLTKEYKGKDPVFVCVLKGSVCFFSDLIREFDDYCDIDFLSCSSYGSGTVNMGIVKINKDLDVNIMGRHVIIVEDIMDSGVTLNHLTNLLAARNPASLKVITLLDKPERRRCAIQPDYCGFIVEDKFVVGYGLDYDQLYRNLPYIGVVNTDLIKG